MVYTAVKLLLDTLTELRKIHPDLIHEAKTEVDSLCLDLAGFKNAVEKAYKEKQTNDTFMLWEEKVQEAIYAIEEIVDTLVSTAMEKRGKSLFAKISLLRHQSIRSLKNVALGKMHQANGEKEIPSWKQDLAKLRSILEDHFANLPAAQPDTIEERVIMDYTAFMAPRHDPVGCEEELGILIGYLKEEADELKVICVTGKAGIGKTTMARRVFNDPRILMEFPLRIWETITGESNIKDVFLSILKVFTKEDLSKEPVDGLGQLVHDYLEMGKFLIIMDGVETVETWSTIEKALPKSNRKGKVLITNNNDAADLTKCAIQAHVLKPLNVEESWKLLRLQVFGRIDNCHQELEPLGKRIAEKSKRFPLSIMLIGGILLAALSQKKSMEITEMKEILEKVVNDMGTDYPRMEIQDQVEYLIRWSYNTLPRDLRNCFLYLGMLPARTQIPVTKLIQLWVAEKFVIQNQRKSLDEAGRQNFMELVNRNLLVVNKLKIGGEHKTCRVHDMIHEFCKNEVGKGKWKLFQELSITPGEPEPATLDIHYNRRLCIHNHTDEFLLKNMNASKVHSFLCFSKFPIIFDPKDTKYLGDTWKRVKVLEAISIQLPKFPVQITQLVHLRYLTMWCKEFNILPEAFSNLFNLHTLVVKTSSPTVEIRADIWKLMNLRQFKTTASILLKKGGGGGEGGKNLKKLSKLAAESFTEDVIERAKNLKQLGIYGPPMASMPFDELKCLDKLTLESNGLSSKQNNPHKVKLPPADKFPPMIRFLVLSGTHLEWAHMSTTVGKIVSLQVLKLKNNALKGDSWDVQSDADFRRLETLTIHQSEIKFWTVPDGAFPKLTSLELDNCQKLEEIPLGLGETLKKLSMHRVTIFAVSYAQKMKNKNGKLNLQVHAARS